MDFETKARIRLEHWINHGREHRDEYLRLAEELAAAGRAEAAAAIREMAELTGRGVDSLARALAALDD